MTCCYQSANFNLARRLMTNYIAHRTWYPPVLPAGWLCYLEEYGDKVKQYTTVGEMAKAAAASHVTGFVTSQPCECLVSAVRKSPLTRRAHQYAVRGVLETGEVLYPDGVLRASLSSSGRRRRRNSFLCRRLVFFFLHWTDLLLLTHYWQWQLHTELSTINNTHSKCE